MYEQRTKKASAIRENALQNSKRASDRMVKSHKRKNPPSKYSEGEIVLVKPDAKDKRLNRPGGTFGNEKAVKAKIVKCRKNDIYEIEYLEEKEVKRVVSVRDITSTNMALEKQKQMEARSDRAL